MSTYLSFPFIEYEQRKRIRGHVRVVEDRAQTRGSALCLSRTAVRVVYPAALNSPEPLEQSPRPARDQEKSDAVVT